MTQPTKANATRFLYETASASDPIDATLVRDYLDWLDEPRTHDAWNKAEAVLRQAQELAVPPSTAPTPETPSKLDAEIARIEAAMEPILAAHRIAAALDQIARLLPLLSVRAQHAYVPGMFRISEGYAAMLKKQAEAIRASEPIEAVTDEERQSVWESTIDSCGDMSRKDTAETLIETWTDADWRYEADMLKAYEIED